MKYKCSDLYQAHDMSSQILNLQILTFFSRKFAFYFDLFQMNFHSRIKIAKKILVKKSQFCSQKKIGRQFRIWRFRFWGNMWLIRDSTSIIFSLHVELQDDFFDAYAMFLYWQNKLSKIYICGVSHPCEYYCDPKGGLL